MSEFDLKNFGYKVNPAKNFDKNMQQKVLNDLHRQGMIEGALKAEDVFKNVNGQMMIDIKGYENHMGHIQHEIEKAVKQVDPSANFTSGRLVAVEHEHIHPVANQQAETAKPAALINDIKKADETAAMAKTKSNQFLDQVYEARQNNNQSQGIISASSLNLPTVRGTVARDHPGESNLSGKTLLDSIIKSGGQVETGGDTGYNGNNVNQ